MGTGAVYIEAVLGLGSKLRLRKGMYKVEERGSIR